MKFSKEVATYIILFIIFLLLCRIFYKMCFYVKEGYRQKYNNTSIYTVPAIFSTIDSLTYKLSDNIKLPNIPAVFPNYDDTYNLYKETVIKLNYVKNINVNFYLKPDFYLTLSSIYVISEETYKKQDNFSLAIYPYSLFGKFINEQSTKIYMFYSTDNVNYFYLCSLPVEQIPIIEEPEPEITENPNKQSTTARTQTSEKSTIKNKTKNLIKHKTVLVKKVTKTLSPSAYSTSEIINNSSSELFNIMTYLPILSKEKTGDIFKYSPMNTKENTIHFIDERKNSNTYDLTTELTLPE